MMEGAGLLLLALALALMLVPPLHHTIARPRLGAVHLAAALLELYHPTPPRADLDALVRDADEALARDPLIHATARIADTYDQA